MASHLDYAQLSGRTYFRTFENRTRIEESGWTEVSWTRDDPITGFSAGVYRKGNDVVISFTGSNESLWKDFVHANIPAGLGMVSSQVQQAMVFVLETIKQYKDTPGMRPKGVRDICHLN